MDPVHGTMSDEEKRQLEAESKKGKEENVSIAVGGSPVHHSEDDEPLSSKTESWQAVDFGEKETEDARALLDRLIEAEQHNQDHSTGLSGFSPPQQHPPQLDSMENNDFVKLEKPQELFSVESQQEQEVNIHLLNRSEEITPSDDVAPPVGDDLRDFAHSPQDAAHGLADRAHETLEQFLSQAGDIASRAGQEVSQAMPHFGESSATGRKVAFDDDTDLIGQQSPIFDQPAQSLHRDTPGLLDGSEAPTVTQQVKGAVEDAAATLGEFASKIVQDAQAAVIKAEDTVEHAAAQVQESVSEDLLGFEENTAEVDAPASLEETTERSSEADILDTPVILPPVRPPTPPKPRAADAPECPPILDLGGPHHPHQQHFPPHQRKPSLKVTSPAYGAAAATGTAPSGNVVLPKGPSWFDLRYWDQRILDLIYWRDVKKSAIVFGVTMALLISLAVFNVITVAAYLGLAALAASFGYRTYNSVANKSDQKNPIHTYLEQSLQLPRDDTVHEQLDVILKNVKDLVHQLRRLFLVEDVLETLKFAVLLWTLTYVGAYFSGTALTILAFVGLFTLPKIYELYQPQIDQYYEMVESKVKQASNVAREQLDKVPFFKKQKPVEKEE